jgi:Mrp family chromosome partitioning ATPase
MSNVETRFQPGFEVDAFRWSSICDELVERHQMRWQTIVESLLAANAAGRNLVGVAGLRRQAGATTSTACLARLLTEAGKSVAVVDGDFETAALAGSLGVAAEHGWEHVLAGDAPLADVVIQSLGDSLTLLPLVQGGAAAAERLDSIHASITAGVLRYHYDIVLFDLGAATDQRQGPIARRLARRCRLDAVVLVGDAATGVGARQSMLFQSAPELADICVGVIDNPSAAA